MLHDEKEYPDPGNFKPERFINDSENRPRNPADVIFGFGRRFVLFLKRNFTISTKKKIMLTKFLITMIVEFVLVAISDYRTFTYLLHRY